MVKADRHTKTTRRSLRSQVRFTGGRNGVGAKATNVFSSFFEAAGSGSPPREIRGCHLTRLVKRVHSTRAKGSHMSCSLLATCWIISLRTKMDGIPWNLVGVYSIQGHLFFPKGHLCLQQRRNMDRWLFQTILSCEETSAAWKKNTNNCSLFAGRQCANKPFACMMLPELLYGRWYIVVVLVFLNGRIYEFGSNK